MIYHANISAFEKAKVRLRLHSSRRLCTK